LQNFLLRSSAGLNSMVPDLLISDEGFSGGSFISAEGIRAELFGFFQILHGFSADLFQ